MKTLSSILGKNPLYGFDIETTVGGKPMPFSLTAKQLIGGSDLRHLTIGLPQGYTPNYVTQKYLERSGYAQAAKGTSYGAGDFNRKVGAFLTDPVVKNYGLLGHNLGFDYRATFGVLDAQNQSNILALYGQKGILNAPDYHTPIRSLLKRNKGKLAYETYKNYLSSSILNNRPYNVDTFTLTKIALASANENPNINIKFSSLAAGAKLGFVKQFLSEHVDKSLSNLQSHSASADIDVSSKYFNFLSERVLPQVTGERPLEQDVIKYLGFIKGIQKTDWLERQAKAEVANYAFSYKNQGRIEFEANSVAKVYDKKNDVAGAINFIWDELPYLKKRFTNKQALSSEFLAYYADFTHGHGQSHIYSSLYGTADPTLIEESFLSHNTKLINSHIDDALKTIKQTAQAGKFYKSTEAQIARRNKFLLYAGLGFGAFAVINGLREKGVSAELRKKNTDFGSPWQGLVKSVSLDIAKSFVKYKDIGLGSFVLGGLYGYSTGDENKPLTAKDITRDLFLNVADDLLIYAGKRIPFVAKQKKLMSFVNSPFFQGAQIGLLGFSVGKFAGEYLRRISGKDDAYNTIEGLYHGGIGGILRRQNTDFGSGYRGPVAPIHHPELDEDYNEAKDVYRFEAMRASKIGLSEAELYRWMTEPDKSVSKYVQASATAGTALHRLKQAEAYRANTALATEQLTYNSRYNVSGHIDIIDRNLGIGDYKTVNAGIYREILRHGPKPSHVAQVQFYLGNEGYDRGFIRYINRDNPSQTKDYTLKFNPYKYRNLLNKVRRVQDRVRSDIAAGILDKSDLPMTASIETLIEANKEKPSPQEEISRIAKYRRDFQEEMAYLNLQKRGMPTHGAGYRRIKKRNEEQSTQGIGLQLNNFRTMHHVM